MDQRPTPQTLQTRSEVADPGLRRAFLQSTFAPDVFLEVATCKKLEHDVDPLGSWYGVHEGYQIGMLDAPQDLDLVIEVGSQLFRESPAIDGFYRDLSLVLRGEPDRGEGARAYLALDGVARAEVGRRAALLTLSRWRGCRRFFRLW